MYKKVFIQNKSYLHYENNSLVIENEQDKNFVCFDDIDTIIIENQHTTVTNTLLANLVKSDINVIFSDERFMPSAILLGINKNSRTPKIQKMQISISKPKQNKLWQEIVKSKLKNQTHILKAMSKNFSYMESLIKQVKSDDKTNIEAVGANYYFKELFGNSFLRHDGADMRNAALNYGYAIFRSSIARYIIAFGLNPSFGIHHKSELNPFNLADDIIEPFRPIIDNYVAKNIDKDLEKLKTNIKTDLVLLLDEIVEYKGKKHQVNDVMKKIVANYQSICLEKTDKLELFNL